MIGFKDLAQQLMDPSVMRLNESTDNKAYGPFERGMTPLGVRRFTDAQRANLYYRDLKEAWGLFKRTMDGDEISKFQFKQAMRGGFREALTVSDFPTLFGDIIDRTLLANYKETPYTYKTWCHLEQVNDFRVARRIRVDYGTGIGILQAAGTGANTGQNPQYNPNSQVLTPIESNGPYPEDKLSTSSYLYNLFKYGRVMPFAWETMVNDDLNALKDTPARFGIGARRMEEFFATSLIANNTNFFKAANNNIVKSTIANLTSPSPPVAFSNPPLSIAGLQYAMIVMAAQRDLTGQPISVESLILMVSPNNEIRANNILNATSLSLNEEGGTLTAAGAGATASNYNAQRLEAQNWMRGRVKLVVNYQLPICDTTYGGTGWYLFADPNYRPAVVFGQLRGHTMPEMFMKTPNSVAIGEGVMGGPGGAGMGAGFGGNTANPIDGNFDTDGIFYKFRSVFGGVQLDPIMACYSNGSNI